MAISTVSLSLISHTIIISGSCLRAVLNQYANVYHISGFTWDWLTPSTWFSTGSSSVIIFTQILFRLVSAEYSVVDLPEPVGPEVNIIPLGKDIAFIIRSLFCHSIHKSLSDGIFLLLSTILITIFSQWTVGSVESLKSSDFHSIVVLILPSWGIRDSSIFKSDNILNLATIQLWRKFWYSKISFNSPSSLYLNLTYEVRGSICISEDSQRTAANII